MDDRFCSALVCGRRGKVEHNGRWYCGIHDPEKKQARLNRRNAIWNAESEVIRATSALSLLLKNIAELALNHPDFTEERRRWDTAQERLASAKAKVVELKEKSNG